MVLKILSAFKNHFNKLEKVYLLIKTYPFTPKILSSLFLILFLYITINVVNELSIDLVVHIFK